MAIVYGITANIEGEAILATAECARQRFKIRTINRWDLDNKVRNALLLHRGINLGVPSHWKSSKSNIGLDALIGADAVNGFAPYSSRPQFNHFYSLLEKNVVSVVPQDAFLGTIPQFVKPDCTESFISFYRNEEYCKFGVVIKGELRLVINLAPSGDDVITSHVGKIQRYLRPAFPTEELPSVLYCFDGTSSLEDATYDVQVLPPVLRKGKPLAEDELVALGIALTQENTKLAPSFPLGSTASSFRGFRTLIYGLSFLFVVMAALAVAVPLVSSWYLSAELEKYRKQYESHLVSNQDLKKLYENNQNLQEKARSMAKNFSRRTKWGVLFEELGKQRPAGLYIDRMASAVDKDNENNLQIVLRGWSTREKYITEYCAALQSLDFISDIKLASLTRDTENASVFAYKIQLTFHARAQSDSEKPAG